MEREKVSVMSPPDMVDDVLFDMVHHGVLNAQLTGFHQHTCIEIIIVYGGTAKHLIGDEVMTLSQGDVCIIHPGCGHALAECHDFDHVTISCSPQILECLGINLSFIVGIREIFTPRKQRFIPFLLNRSELTDAQKIFSIMEKAYKFNKIEEKGNLRSYFAMILCLFAQAYLLHRIPSQSTMGRISRVLCYMNENFRKNLSLPQLAAMANLSVCEFGRVFKKQYGVTPIKYILDLRLRESLRLLRDSHLSCAEIAYEVGIVDSNYFSKIFRNYFGASPREIRKSYSK
jgi:AraC-like DNA-binding protein